jgi:hypothetical protein
VSESLSVISGVVTELVVHTGEEEFIRSASDQVVGVGTAAALAAAGLAGAAAGASLATASAGDSVEFFECKVGGRLMTGRFSKASFKEGDEVMFIVPQQQADDPIQLALAATRKIDQTLWMAPHCSRGTRAHRAFVARMFVWLLVLAPLFIFANYLVFGVWLGESRLDVSQMHFEGGMSVAMGAVAAIHLSIRYYKRWLPVAHRAEQIFAVLGYPAPPRVDLPLDHKRYCKAHSIKWPYLTDGPWIYHYLDEH